MKKIHYRKSNSEYEKGYFIPFKKILGIIYLLIFGVCVWFVDFYMKSIELSYWIEIPLMITAGVIIMYLTNFDDHNKFRIDKYLTKEIKKKKGKTERYIGQLQNSFIGDYEFKSIVNYGKNLQEFYQNCLKELDELQKKDIEEYKSIEIQSTKDGIVHYQNSNGKISWQKLQLLKRKLSDRLDVLEKINTLNNN